MRARRLRRILGHVRKWPIHPQWLLTTSGEDRELVATLSQLCGLVLDIGCAGGRLSGLLPVGCEYLGVDYPATAQVLYETKPGVYADARALPFAHASVDAVILKDVLEHVPSPERALAETARVLKDGGRLILWIPFMYPIHDAPHDYQRLTEHGLRACLESSGMTVNRLQSVLTPVETAALLSALAWADAADQILARRRWLAFLLPFLALGVVLANLTGKCLRWLPATAFLPAGYRVVATRRQRAPHESACA